MTTEPKTVDDLIEAFGGNSAFAEIAGVGVTAVYNYRSRGALPPRLYLPVSEEGKRRRIQVPAHLFRETPRMAGEAA